MHNGNMLVATNLTGAYFARSRPAQNKHSSQRKNRYVRVWNWETRSGAAAARCWGD